MLSSTAVRGLAVAATCFAAAAVPATSLAQPHHGGASHVVKKKHKKVVTGKRGPRGKTGRTGAAGPAGPAGTAGAAGAPGAQGLPGSPASNASKMFHVTMAIGEADRTVLTSGPFTLKARCALVSAPGVTPRTFTPSLVLTSSEDHTYVDSEGGEQKADTAANTEVLVGKLNGSETEGAAADSNTEEDFYAATPSGKAMDGLLSIGTNVLGTGAAAKACLFVGHTTIQP